MILLGYSLNGEDAKSMDRFRKTTAYGSYVEAIGNSPLFISMMNHHANSIDISPDIQRLKTEGKVDGGDLRALNILVKTSIEKMMVPVVADALILKEMEDLKIDSILSGLKKDSDIEYLLGLSSSDIYKKAEEMIKAGTIAKDTLAYKGYLEWKKKEGKSDSIDVQQIDTAPQPTETIPTTVNETKKQIATIVEL
jgi:hypothetical protein